MLLSGTAHFVASTTAIIDGTGPRVFCFVEYLTSCMEQRRVLLYLMRQTFHMQVPLDGRELQLLLAFIHAIWRCRCAVVRGCVFTDARDLTAHFRSLIDDPWLHGNPAVLSRAERRII